MFRPHPSRRSLLTLRCLSPVLLLVPLLPLLTTPARAGSATAESVWDRNDARKRAMQQIPRGAAETGTQCEEISVGHGDSRYRCTVFYVDPPARSLPSGAQPDPAHPRP
jgi:hypothetical protein